METNPSPRKPNILPRAFSLYLRLTRSKWFVLLVVLLPFLFLVLTGISSVDFGYHWDEKHHLGVAKNYVLSEQLLAEWYIYPSMTSYIALLVTIPYIIPLLLKPDVTWPAVKGYLFNQVFNDNPSYPLNVRKAFLVISALAILWIYIYKLKKGRHWSEALLAAAILAFSWEAAYHVRFIASDGILMQFGILVTLFCLLAVRSQTRSRFWLLMAAVAAGLATSTKYPAGLFLLPVLLAAYQRWDRRDFWKSLVPLFVGLTMVFAVSYLAITPGTVLDPFTFYDDLKEAVVVYGSGHGMHTVTSNFDYLLRVLVYLFAVFPSHYLPLSLVLSVFAIVGVASVWRESRAEAVLFFVFPVVYILFFSFQSVFFVRNYLLLFPFVAILIARGVAYVYQSQPARWVRIALVCLVVAILAVNANWVAFTAGTIRDRGSDRFVRELYAYLEHHPESNYLVSERVWNDLSMLGMDKLANITTTSDRPFDAVVVYYSESMDRPGYWPVNFPGLAPLWFGLKEINMDYYALWQGDDRILVMDVDQARALDALILREDAK